jgi:type I restriction enzyme, S subunit
VSVPKLRFPEFQNALEWKQDTLEKVAHFVTERIALAKLTVENYISTENILPDYEGVTRASKLPASGSATRFKVNDVLISNIRPYLKKVWFSNKEGGASNDVVTVRATETINVKYLSFLLKNDTFIEYVMKGAKGVKMPRGDISLMKEYPLAYPTLLEQQKIADCLSSLESVISAQSQRLEALKQHKQGLMQRLFPAEGETVPKLRFLEFQDAGEWEEKRLSELFEFRNGLNADKERYGKGHKYISVMDIISGKPITYNSIINSVEITEKELDSFMVQYGDILFQRSSETQEEAGQANVYLDQERPAIFGGFVIRAKKISEYIPLFMNALLASMRVRREIISKSAGSTRYNIGQETLSVIVILVPGLKEQQKIADCLTSLESIITSQTQKLEALKTFKKGLMQQLFPAPLEGQA